MALTRLPGSKWWVETDDVTNDIIGTYNKAAITADIQAIKATLTLYPDATQDATDVASLQTAIGQTGWTEAKKARVTALVNAMYAAYQGDSRVLEAAQLQARLDSLTALRDRLV